MESSGYEYHAAGGETFDSIALEVYKDEKYAAELMCFNPSLCEKNVFMGGEVLELPVIDVDSEEEAQNIPSSAPWKEG